MNLLRQAVAECAGLRQRNNRWRAIYRAANTDLRMQIQRRHMLLLQLRMNELYKRVFVGRIGALFEPHPFLALGQKEQR